jgi:hypothetical protein
MKLRNRGVGLLLDKLAKFLQIDLHHTYAAHRQG